MMHLLCLSSLGLSLLTAILTLLNLREYRQPPLLRPAADPVPGLLSVIIPARNEQAGIAECLACVLASTGCTLEVLVLDDSSTDATAQVVAAVADRDSRVRLLHGTSLPAGWNGKQHACWLAAQQARGDRLLFLDADVRLQPEAAGRMSAFLMATGAALVSGFPRQVTVTPMERLLIPYIHFVLLGLLPMGAMRRSNAPGFAAGCGQFLLVDRASYFRCGGHAAIRATMHDGLLLPRLLRQHGLPTRLADLTELASCRMYRSAAEVWLGLAKNATEGLAAPARILPMTLLLGVGHVLPLPLLVAATIAEDRPAALAAGGALVLSYLPRVLEARRFRQSWLGAALHPLGMATLLALQWYALLRKLLGRPARWKERAYAAN